MAVQNCNVLDVIYSISAVLATAAIRLGELLSSVFSRATSVEIRELMEMEAK